MKRKKRFMAKILIILLAIFLSAVAVIVLSQIIYKKKKKLVNNHSLEGKDTINIIRQRHLQRYCIYGWSNNTYILTAKELHERVMEDSKSDYNWIAPARELVRICKKLSFPADYALDIKIAILNCFANIEHRANCGGSRYIDDPKDEKAVQYCYNSLYGIENEEAIIARKRYLTEMIEHSSYTRFKDSLYHPGPTFRKLRKNWIESKFKEYISQEKIDFKQLVKTLHNDFAEIVKKAESNGEFEEDEKKEKESWRKFYERMNDIDV